MDKVQKWEIAGVPAALAFEAALRLGWLDAFNVTAEQVPHLMVAAFILMASVRAGADYFTKRSGQVDDA